MRSSEEFAPLQICTANQLIELLGIDGSPVSGSTAELYQRAARIALTALMLGIIVCCSRAARGDDATNAREQDPITLEADYSQEWTVGRDHVAILRGRCRVVQGATSLTAQKMVIWHRSDASATAPRDRVAVYAEDDVRWEQPGQTLTEPTFFISLATHNATVVNVRQRLSAAPSDVDPLFQRAVERRRAVQQGNLQPTQFVSPGFDNAGPQFQVEQMPQPTGPRRRIRILPRSSVPLDVTTEISTATTPPERIVVIRGGVIVLVDGVEVGSFGNLGTIDLSADRVVLWLQGDEAQSFSGELQQDRDTPMQIYLEGNIVVRQGTNTLRANQAYYDVREERALLTNAELRSFIPQLGSDLRVNARQLRQIAPTKFLANDAWFTASQFGKPGYRLQATDVLYEQRNDAWIGTGNGPVDPITGQSGLSWITSHNNTVYLGDLPVFYLPRVSGPAEDPNIPLRRATVGQDRVFGFQVQTVWDLFQITGAQRPPGMNWDLLVDGFTERGPAVGTSTDYRTEGLFGLPGLSTGEGLLYYIHDDGRDNLGRDRRSLEPETKDRYRAELRHRQDLPDGMSVIGELGVLSDRNFLEQYYEEEFDTGKDVETLLYLTESNDNWAWSILGRPQTNEFQDETEWLPRGDLFALSEPLFNGFVTWSMHSSAGYGNIDRATPPTDPNDVFTPIPYIVDASGGVFMTRHQLDAPFSLGPVQIVPYALGEAAYWGDSMDNVGGTFVADNEAIDRFVGRLGLRASMMFWRIYPYVQSNMFNLNGLAHKIRVEGDYSYTDSSRDLDEIPQWNEIDDYAQEKFRERLLTNTFGGVLPDPFEPRFFAVRTGAGSGVTDPWHELIDDQQVLRMAVRQRLQTKVGPPERMRIKDWMRLDMEAAWFPDPERDNFGEDIGLLSGRYRWNVGDRTSLLASAYYDLFDDAQQVWNAGVLSQRSARGSIYAGIRQVKGGPLDSQILTGSYSYLMSPKWASTVGTAYDLAEGRNRGQSLTVTRIGADFNVHMGVNVDASKDNVGVQFAVEPRFGSLTGAPTQLSSLLGVP